MIVKTKEQYKEVIEKLKEESIIAMDTETQEFSKERTHAFELDLDGVGVYSPSVKAYIPVEYLDKTFQEVLDKPEIIFHNFKFDGVIIQKQGYDISKIKYHDTMIMSWLLNENRFSHGLKNLAESVLKVKKEKIVEFRDVNKRPVLEEYGLFPDEFEKDTKIWLKNLGMYCIDDCKYTYKLFHKFKPKMEKEDLWPVYEKVEMPIIKLLIDMEVRGIKINLKYLRRIGDAINQDVIELQAKIWTEAGREFDINSPKQLAEVLYKERELRLPEEFRTPTGAYSTNVKALEFLERNNPEDKLVGSLLKYRELFKLSSTYIKGLFERNKDGVIYASFKQHGTQTGRFSSSNPNLQQLPRRNDKYDIRKAFVAREGYTFVICDLSQIELRVIAYLSKDPIMMKAFQEGKDIHQETADKIKSSRTIAKTVNFGIAYGTSAYGMAKNLGISKQEAEKFIKEYFMQFKKLAILMVQAKNTLKRNYAIRTLFRRKRRFPKYAQARKDNDWKLIGHIERQSINSIVQGSAADLIKLQMRELAKVLPEYDAHMVVQIHDEVIVECPKEKAEEVLKVVKHTMEHAIELPGIPLVADGFISNYWKK
jgi:DNA polymerase I